MQLTTLPADAPSASETPRKRRTLPKRLLLLPALAVLAAGGFALYQLFSPSESSTPLTETLTTGSLATTITGTGVTLPADSQTATVASTAEITKVYVAAGDIVQAGDLLYEQDDSELDEQIGTYQDQIADLQDELTTAQTQLSDLQETLSHLTVTAPFSGTITEVEVEAGDSVQAGTKLAQLVDDSQMTLTEYYSYAYESEIRVGSKAQVSIASLMLNLDGTVTDVQKVSRYTTEGTKCFAVTITVDNPGALTQGMSCASSISSSSGQPIYAAISGTLEYKDSETLTAEASGELTQVTPVAYGTVTAVSYEATNSNGVAYFPVTIQIPSGGELSAGVNVSYSIQVGDTSEGLLAPISALKRSTDGETCLYIQSDTPPEQTVEAEGVPDGFYAVPVEVGDSNSQYVRILSGAEEGDVVFTRYQQSAPANGDTTSQGEESQEQAFPGGEMQMMPAAPGGDFSGGFSGGGGGMPGGGRMGG